MRRKILRNKMNVVFLLLVCVVTLTGMLVIENDVFGEWFTCDSCADWERASRACDRICRTDPDGCWYMDLLYADCFDTFCDYTWEIGCRELSTHTLFVGTEECLQCVYGGRN